MQITTYGNKNLISKLIQKVTRKCFLIIPLEDSRNRELNNVRL